VEERFERLTQPVFGSKVCNRDEANASLTPEQARSLGEFLGRLWARFGPAEPIDDGFSYSVRDRKTGLTFTAYSGPSGPAYGGGLPEQRRLMPVLKAFERWLCEAEPVDCAIERESDFGPFRAGFRNGRAFEESIALGPDPGTARPAAECRKLAVTYGRGDVARGWTYAFERVLEAPDEMTVRGRRASFLGLGPSPGGVFAFFEDGGSPFEVPIEELEWPRTPALDLWLEAYRKRRR
jgi:hypothetical protein